MRFTPPDQLRRVFTRSPAATRHGSHLRSVLGLRFISTTGVRKNLEPPNMRLKLAGGDRSKESGVFAPWRARTFVHYSCAAGRVARSLSAIR